MEVTVFALCFLKTIRKGSKPIVSEWEGATQVRFDLVALREAS
jgi:hypothetical protein